MLYLRKTIKLSVLYFLLLFCNCSLSYADNSQTDTGEILFITSHRFDSQYISNNIRAFAKVYTQLGGRHSIVLEYFEANSLNEADQWEPRLKKILSKHPDTKLVLLLGGEVWSAFFNLKGNEYKKIPIACVMASNMGIESFQTDTANVKHNLQTTNFANSMRDYNVKFSYSYHFDISKNLELIQQIYPNLKKLVFLTDNTYFGLNQKLNIKRTFKPHSNITTSFLDGRTMSYEMVLDSIRHEPENTVLFLVSWTIDKKGFNYINHSIDTFDKANPKLPVFSLTASAIGYWSIGGYVPKYGGIGDKIAYSVYQLLDKHQNISLEMNMFHNEYVFDSKKLKQFGISKKQIPKNSLIINQEPSFFKTYNKEVRIIAVIFIILLVILALSLYYSYKTKHLKNHLERTTLQLEEDKIKLETSEKDLRIAKDKAEDANRLKSAFVSNMSHEIRTPLNAIVGFSSLLISSMECTEEQKEYAEIIQDNSHLLLQLINDVLDISRLESKKLKFTYEWCDVKLFCEKMITLVNENKSTTTKAKLIVPEETYQIYTDPLRLQQIVVNLLNNAQKFTPAGGKITLEYKLDEKEEYILFSVTDTGCGIPADKQKCVFERFEKLDEFIQGTGLGLSICQVTIQRMGGDIWIDSSYKLGSRFVFSHPYKVN